MITLDDAPAIARTLPGVEAGTSYGTTAFRARQKFLARMYEDGESLVIKVGEVEQRFLIEAEPETYYTRRIMRAHRWYSCGSPPLTGLPSTTYSCGHGDRLPRNVTSPPTLRTRKG